MNRRAKSFGILRLTAGILAGLGLLGHGLAMLVVGVLAQPNVATQPTFAAVLEICSAGGPTEAVAEINGTERGAAESQHRPTRPASGKIDSCPICSAFSQTGAADLPAACTLYSLEARPAVQPPAQQIAAKTPFRLHSLSRGPPAAA